MHCLKPGGIFYIVEFHPFTNMFNAEWTDLTEAYFEGDVTICSEVNGSYADFNEKFSHLAYEWSHSLSDIVNSLRKEGLILEFLNEFTYCNYNYFPNIFPCNKPIV
ncbi:hypothetical protein JCM31447_26050 [Fluviispira sanaruensis]|uniref:Methyltransferase n=1 Tax=Fluviispira sanaruensis TaxID=2493639 RepID=A0A4V0P2R5_FLUSA|nr:hypothetical protein JCM31447_26050 [Fluviispira sanaruensis]